MSSRATFEKLAGEFVERFGRTAANGDFRGCMVLVRALQALEEWRASGAEPHRQVCREERACLALESIAELSKTIAADVSDIRYNVRAQRQP